MKTLLKGLLLSVGTGLLPAPSYAQSSERGAWPSRYYVAAYLATVDYEVFYPSTPNLGGTNPWTVATGWQLTPHLVVQFSYAYSHDKYYKNPDYTGTTIGGQQVYGWRSSDTWTHTIPLTLRYELVRLPGSRLRVDILGGYTWLSARTTSAGEEFINGQSKGIFSTGDHTTQSYVTLGLAARYVFSRRFEGVFEYGRARNLKTASEAVHLETTGNKWGLTRSMSLGVRYRFNIHKPAK
ncbi:MAG: hypothetical protein EOO60_04185 [Hymenobacter sp.]|nr:MAG: hypothetical protein EOO60_04185 [Hymenobacter sp.]